VGFRPLDVFDNYNPNCIVFTEKRNLHASGSAAEYLEGSFPRKKLRTRQFLTAGNFCPLQAHLTHPKWRNLSSNAHRINCLWNLEDRLLIYSPEGQKEGQ